MTRRRDPFNPFSDFVGFGSTFGVSSRLGIVSAIDDLQKSLGGRAFREAAGLSIIKDLQKSLPGSAFREAAGLSIIKDLQKSLPGSAFQRAAGLGFVNDLQKSLGGRAFREAAGLSIIKDLQKSLPGSAFREAAGLSIIKDPQESLLGSVFQRAAGLGFVKDIQRASVSSRVGLRLVVESSILSALRGALGPPVFSRQIELLRSAAKSLAENHSLSALASSIAVVGLAGSFDLPAIDAAVAAAELVEAKADEPEELEQFREKSVLVDTVADVQLFSQQAEGASEAEVQQKLIAAIETVLSKIESRLSVAQSPPERVSLVTWMGLVFAVLSFLSSSLQNYQNYLAYEFSRQSAGGNQPAAIPPAEHKQLDEAQLEELKRISASMERVAEQLCVMEEKRADLYLVERQTRLLSGFSRKATKLAELYPNQIVTIVQRKHKWLKVQYQDHLSEEIREGWVMKKYLRKLEK